MISDQVKSLRAALKLSQTAFGEKLGVSRDVIKNIENDLVAPSGLFFHAAASAFNVNEEWLRTGEGDMFKPSDDSILSALSQKYHLGDMELHIIETFLNLPPAARATVTDFLQSLSDPTAAARMAQLRQEADIAIANHESNVLGVKIDA